MYMILILHYIQTYLYELYILYLPGGEEVVVGVGDNAILQCNEAKHQPVSSVEWFCRSEGE